MNDNSSFGGLFRQHKPLETGLLALGLALFIFLGARGINKIGDMQVAAGEAQRSGTVQSDSGQYSFQPFGTSTVSGFNHQLQPAPVDNAGTGGGGQSVPKELPEQAKTKASPAAQERAATQGAKGARPSRAL